MHVYDYISRIISWLNQGSVQASLSAIRLYKGPQWQPSRLYRESCQELNQTVERKIPEYTRSSTSNTSTFCVAINQ